jgi:hypothetical protein
VSISKNQPAAEARLLITPRLLRDLHTYLAVLFAPTILFFALTGSLQVFGLHEGQANGYQPLAFVEKLSQVHIHMLYQLKPRKSEPPKAAVTQAPIVAEAAPVKAAEPAKPKAKRGPSVVTKAFFGAAAIGLTLASLLGLWIGLTQGRLRKVSAVLAVLGAILPIALVMFS